MDNMDNDGWLSNLAAFLGVADSTASPDHSVATTSAETHHNFVNDANLADSQSLRYQATLPIQSHEPHAWQPHTTWLHSDHTKTTTAGLINVAHEAALGNPEALNPHHHFDPSHTHNSIIIGNPIEVISHYHQQETPYSCGIAAQRSEIEHLTNHNFSEAQLRQNAQAHGWYDPNHGTNVADFGKVLAETAQVPVESHFGGTIAEIGTKLNQGEAVFVSVNSTIEWLPDRESLLGQSVPQLFDPHHFAGQPADHIVQIAGLEINPFDPQHSYAIINDSASPTGKGIEIPIDQLQQAMAAGHGFIASTAMHTHPSNASTYTSTNSIDTENMYFGCSLSVYESNHSIHIDGSQCGTYNGNSIYWNSGKLAGSWNCENHYAYDANGHKLGYAATWREAALLVLKQA
jgi:hypothetical protein